MAGSIQIVREHSQTWMALQAPESRVASEYNLPEAPAKITVVTWYADIWQMNADKYTFARHLHQLPML